MSVRVEHEYRGVKRLPSYVAHGEKGSSYSHSANTHIMRHPNSIIDCIVFVFGDTLQLGLDIASSKSSA